MLPDDDVGSLVVAIGLGADGVEGLRGLFQALSARASLVYVVAISDSSLLPSEVLTVFESLDLPARQVGEGGELTSRQILVVPSFLLASISGRHLSVQQPDSELGLHRPLDTLFQGLARARGSLSVAVLLAGTGNDGLAGLAEVRAGKGLALAQHESSVIGGPSAEALRRAAEVADKALSPMELADHLERFCRARQSDDPFLAQESELQNLFALLHQASAVDFGRYKPTTVRRRILKRMVLRQTSTIEEYVALASGDPAEVLALYSELLVGVTELFRDPQVFAELDSTVIPELLANGNPGRPLRVWVPGCSRGDEVYSLAISFLEAFRQNNVRRILQIFATDLNEASLSQARAGLYPASVIEDLPTSVQPYFLKIAEGYQISRAVRELCVFARQDVTQDPPFSHLDLVSCRNLLIYLSPSLQKKALQHFHYALRPGGYLLLGSSESLGECEPLFTTVNKKCKLFSRRPVRTPQPLNFSSSLAVHSRSQFFPEAVFPMDASSSDHDVQKQADRLILARYSPPGLVVDENFDVIQFRGRTGAYLEPPIGAATHNVLKMAREGLLAALRSAMEEALSSQRAVRRENVQVHSDGDSVRRLSLDVIPVRLAGPKARCLLILFVEHPGAQAAEEGLENPGDVRPVVVDPSVEGEILYLRHELLATREYLNAIIQERESSNEELKAANEEAQSANEELQSANEELETAKEELQSTNEELATINEELHERNLQLHRANSDLNNILGSVEMPVVILDCELVIRRFTPSAQALLNLIPGDIGRPFYQVRAEIEVPRLEEMVRDVLDTLTSRSIEQAAKDGRWFLVQVKPYKTLDNIVDGAVLSFADITELKTSKLAELDSDRTSSRLLEIYPRPLALLDGDLKVVEANSRFHTDFPAVDGQAEGASLMERDGVGEELIDIATHYAMSEKSTSEQHQVNLPGKSVHTIQLRKIKLHSRHHVVLEIHTAD